MIQSLFVLNATGEVIIEKHWKGMRGRDETITFWNAMLAAMRLPVDVPPFIPTGGNSVLVHLHRADLFFLASVGTDTLPLSATHFLSNFAATLLHYFGELNEHAIKENFITVYELLDEMLDSGFPLTVEPNILTQLIPPPTVLTKVITNVTGDSTSGTTKQRFPTASPHTPWRRNDVKYANNEIFVDVEETVDAIFSAPPSGANTYSSHSYAPHLIHAIVRGQILVNSRLSGVPDIAMSIASKCPLDDASFHNCVRRDDAYSDVNTLSFIPPDGPFILMSYIIRDRTSFSLPIEIMSNISLDHKSSTGSVTISLRPRFTPPSFTPGPSNTSFSTSSASTPMNSNMSHMTNTPPLSVGGVPGNPSSLTAASAAASLSQAASAASAGGSMMLAQVIAAGGRITNTHIPKPADTLLDDAEITLPFGAAVANASLSSNCGSVDFDAANGTSCWRVGAVPRGVTPTLTGTLSLAPGALGASATVPCVAASFKIPGYAISGMCVNRLEVGPSEAYKYFKGLRCMTKAERYELRPAC